MKNITKILLLIFGLSALVRATPVNVAEISINDWTFGGTTATLRIVANDAFFNNGGRQILRGSAANNSFYKQIPCGVSGTTVTCAAFVLDSTTDSSVPTATYSAYVYDAKNVKRADYLMDFRVPTSLGDLITWSQISVYNNTAPRPPNPTYPTTDQVNSLIQQQVSVVSSPDATTTIKGKVTLSTGGTTVAVADTDPRIQKTLALNYSNSLSSAIANIGATAQTLLVVDADTMILVPTTIPANITLDLRNGAKILKGNLGATLQIAGNNLLNPRSNQAYFVGFLPGDIKFTGANYPKQISTDLWANATLSSRINAIDQSVLGKTVEIMASSGTFGERVILNDNHSLTFGLGEFFNNVAIYEFATFDIGDNVVIKGQGIGKTIVYEPTTGDGHAMGLFYSRAVQISGSNGRNKNITISDMTIQGIPSNPQSDNKGAIQLGNVENFYIQRIHFKGTHGYGAYVGGHGGEGYHASSGFITDSIFENLGTQNVGTINAEGVIIERNIFIEDNNQISTNAALVDVELDATTPSEKTNSISVSYNIFRTGVPNGNRLVDAIKINSYGSRTGKNVKVTGNQITGWSQGTTANNGRGFNYGIYINSIESIEIAGNTVQGTNNVGLWMQDVGSANVRDNTFTSVGNYNDNFGWYLIGVTNSIFRNNSFPLIRGDADGGTEAASGGVHFGSAKTVVEVNRRVNAVFTTTGGISTAIVGANTTNGAKAYTYDWWLGKPFTVEAGSGINAGTYTITAINFATSKLTLSGNVGNGTTAATVNLANNQFIDNLYAEYYLQPGSRSFNSAVRFTEDWTVTAAGSLAQTGDVAWRFFPEAATVSSYAYKIRTAPVSGTTPIMQLQSVDVYGNVLSVRDVYLTATGAGVDYVAQIAPLAVPAGSYLKWKIIQGATDTNAANATISLYITR